MDPMGFIKPQFPLGKGVGWRLAVKEIRNPQDFVFSAAREA